MTTHSLLDGAAFLGALILFGLAALTVVVVAAGMIVAVVGSIARLVKRGPRDRVLIDHDNRVGLEVPDSIDPETEAKMRAAFGGTQRDAGLSGDQKRTIREAFGPRPPGEVDLDAMLRGDAMMRVKPEKAAGE